MRWTISRIRTRAVVLARIPVRQPKRASTHVQHSTSGHRPNITIELSQQLAIISSRQDGKRTLRPPVSFLAQSFWAIMPCVRLRECDRQEME